MRYNGARFEGTQDPKQTQSRKNLQSRPRNNNDANSQSVQTYTYNTHALSHSPGRFRGAFIGPERITISHSGWNSHAKIEIPLLIFPTLAECAKLPGSSVNYSPIATPTCIPIYTCTLVRKRAKFRKPQRHNSCVGAHAHARRHWPIN